MVDAPEIPVEIYKLYLKGRYHIIKMSKPDIEKGHFDFRRKSLQKQPNFALAYLGIHLGYTLLGTMGMIPADEAFAKGQPFLDKAIGIGRKFTGISTKSFLDLLVGKNGIWKALIGI